MADPLSIIVSVVTLIQVSVRVTILLRQFRDEAREVDATLTGLLNDVDSFQQVLESMKETFDQDEIKSNLQITGHAGSHWKNLARSLEDGTKTLQQLHTLLEGLNKTTSFLDGPRRQIRFKSAFDQIATYRDQIQSYRAGLQLSLSTIILWNQVTFQKSTDKIPEKIIPTLDKLYDEFRSLGAALNAKIENLQTTVSNQSEQDGHELTSMSNLRECVRSAADVVSTASSTLTVEASDRVSVKHGSDFGDVFVKDANETMLRWMSSNTVYEFDDMEPLPDPSEASTGDVPTEYMSDSDSDIESEMIRALFNNAKKLKEDGDFTGAERKLRNCLTRFSTNASSVLLTPPQSASVSGVSKAELLELLTDTYCLLGSWKKAKATLMEKLSVIERQVGKKDELYLWDTMKLAELMMKNKEYVEAHLHCRRSLRGFKKLGEPGFKGYEKCLTFLIELCHDEGKVDEEEAYAALLGSHQAKAKRRSLSNSRPEALATTKGVVHTNESSISTSQNDRSNIHTPDMIMNEGQRANSGEQQNIDGVHGENTEKKDNIRAGGMPTPEPQPLSPSRRGLVPSPPIKSPVAIMAARRAREEQKQKEQRVEVRTPNSPYPMTSPGTSDISSDHTISTKDTSTSGETPTTELSASIYEDKVKSVLSRYQVLSSREQTPRSASETSEPFKQPALQVTSSIQPNTGPLWPPGYNAVDLDALEREYTSKLAVSTFRGQLFQSGPVDMATKDVARKSHSRSLLDLLTKYCERFQGRVPYFSAQWELNGWSCMVKINATQGCKVSGEKTEQLARDAATAEACRLFISPALEELLSNNEKLRDPFSDKEVFVPEIDKQWKEVSDRGETPFGTLSPETPRIMISYDKNAYENPIGRVELPAQELSVRRTASDSQLSRNNALDVDLPKNAPQVSSTDTSTSATKHRRAITITGGQLSPPFQDTEWTPGDEEGLNQPHGQQIVSTGSNSWRSNSPPVKYADGAAEARTWLSTDDMTCETCGKDLSQLSGGESWIHTSTCTGDGSFQNWLVKPENVSVKSIGRWINEDEVGDPSRGRRNGQVRDALFWSDHHEVSTTDMLCPICNEDMRELSENSISTHVNSCIDGNPVPIATLRTADQRENDIVPPTPRLPTPLPLTHSISQDPPAPLSGLWACDKCKSECMQYLTENTCASCGRQCDRQCPQTGNDFIRKPFDQYRTLLTSLDLDALVTPDGRVLRRKVLLLGDTLCGKTWLASAWSRDTTPDVNTPLMNTFTQRTKVEGHQIELVIWDHSGMGNYERIRRQFYDDTHVVLICFDISNQDSLDNVEHMWNMETNNYLRDVPKILVGCKKDLRSGAATLNRHMQQKTMPVSPYKADQMASRIGALAYFETSALQKQGLHEVFDYVAEAALKKSPRQKVSGIRRFLSRSEMRFKP